jgi:uncharacterized protein (TIGR00730 family)
MKRICVFCGSSSGARPEYAQAARQLGRAMARRNLGLVYGGASIGIMGEIASTVLDAGGEVIGVIPRGFVISAKELAFTELADLRVVDSMHERKALMAELADGFIALPGGLGTMEEFFEVLTWAQLSLHPKPCGLLNVCQYFDKLMDFLDYAIDQQFMSAEGRSKILIDESPENLLKKLECYQSPEVNEVEWVLPVPNNGGVAQVV